MAVVNSAYNFHFGTYAEWLTKKKADTLVEGDLYFTTNPYGIYVGAVAASVPFVTYANDAAKPADLAQGHLYVNLETRAAFIYDGTAEVSLLPAIETIIGEGTDKDGNLATIGAIKSYVSTAAGGGVTAVAYVNDETHSNSLEITTGTDTKTYVALPVGMEDVSYAAATGIMTFTLVDGTTKTVDLPMENLLSSAAYDTTSHKLTLSFLTESGTAPIEVDLSGLVDPVSVASTNSITMAMSDAGEITANAVVDAAGAITIGAKGLAVQVGDSLTIADNKIGAKISTTAGNLLSVDANGLFVAPIDTSVYVTKELLAATGGAALIGVSAGTGVLAGQTTVQGSVTALGSEIDKLKGGADVAGSIANSIAGHATELAATAGATKVGYTSENTNYTGVTTVGGALDVVATKLDSQNTSISGLTGRLDTAETNITANSTAISTNTSNIAAIQTRLTWKAI